MQKLLLIAVVALTALNVGLAAAADDRPNIIVFYTDDHGHADLSCQGVLNDVKTPNVDSIAAAGVLARHGYSTAPQCVPSRAGLMVGKFQSRFGVESNGRALDGFNREWTIAERLQAVGYATAQFGKWHLGPGHAITEHGFKHVFAQNAKQPFAANITLDGKDREMSNLAPEMYHIDACSRAAASIIERYKNTPFFLYIAYRAPHVPLDAPQKYLDRFPGQMPERRRQALAMLSAVDDGVGLVTRTLAQHNLSEKTLLFYIGDNGAPLKIHKLDAPGGGPGWDGSLNDPLNGEKGMLSEGGMHVPFVVAWPGTIPGAQIYDHPISALDVAATIAGIVPLETKPGDLDGVNLIPYLTGENRDVPHEVLTWRWTAQSAIRSGKWKLLRGGDREYLFNLEADLEENRNVAAEHPEIAAQLRTQLESWAAELDPPGLANGEMSTAATGYFDFYLDGKPAAPLREKFVPGATAGDPPTETWLVRNGELAVEDKALRVIAAGDKANAPMLVRSKLGVPGPVTATVSIRSSEAGEATLAWRTATQKSFLPECRTTFDIKTPDQWQTSTVTLPVEGRLIHLRVVLPSGVTSIRGLTLQSASGKAVDLW